MSALFWLSPVVVIGGTVVLVAIMVAIFASGGRLAGTNTTIAVAAVRRRTLQWRFAGLAAGIAGAWAIADTPASWLGVGTALAAPVFGLGLLAGVLGGELSAAGSSGPTREAALEVRTVRSFVPMRLAWAVAVTTAVLVVFLSITAIAASPDDMGRFGRSLAVWCGEGVLSAESPWPGTFYGVPIVGSVLLGLALAALAFRSVARRRRPLPDDESRAADDQVRRTSARVITAACGVMVAAPLAGCALLAASALRNASVLFDTAIHYNGTSVNCPATGMQVASWVALGVGAAAGIATCYFTAATLFPRRS